MAGFDVFKDGWHQQSLVEPSVVEAHLLLGIIASVDHGQVQIELRDPTTNVLLGLNSLPHVPLVQMRGRAQVMLGDLLSDLENQGWLPTPFPDRAGGPG